MSQFLSMSGRHDSIVYAAETVLFTAYEKPLLVPSISTRRLGIENAWICNTVTVVGFATTFESLIHSHFRHRIAVNFVSTRLPASSVPCWPPTTTSWSALIINTSMNNRVFGSILCPEHVAASA